MPEDVWDSLGTPQRLQALAAANTVARRSFIARNHTAAACHGLPIATHIHQASFSEIRRTPGTYPHPEPVTVNPPFGPALVFSPVATIADLATRFGIRDAVRAGDVLVAEQPGLLDDLHQRLREVRRIPGAACPG